MKENLQKLSNSHFFEVNFLARFYLFLIIAMQAADLLSTSNNLNKGLHESNIILIYAAKFIGMNASLIVSKILICAVFVWAYARSSKASFILSSSIVFSVYSIVVMNNLNLIHI